MPPPGTNLTERFILYSNLYSSCIFFGAQLLQLPGGGGAPRSESKICMIASGNHTIIYHASALQWRMR